MSLRSRVLKGAALAVVMSVPALAYADTDGAVGSVAGQLAKAAGARVLAEDPSLAVMSGMPRSAVDAGVVQQVASIDGLARAVVEFASSLSASAAVSRPT